MYYVNKHDLLMIYVKLKGMGKHNVMNNTINISFINDHWEITLENPSGRKEKHTFQENNREIIVDCNWYPDTLIDLIWMDIKKHFY